MQDRDWPRFAVVGAGAVGCFFGGMLARAGAPVTLIGRRSHVDAINRDGLQLESLRFQDRVRVPATTDIQGAHDAEVVLLAVKTLDTESATSEVAPHLTPGSLLISLQNGVDSVERIRAASGIDAVAAAVYVAAAMSSAGHVRHAGRGDLILGEWPGRPPGAADRKAKLERVAAAFARADVPCRVSSRVQDDLWTKMVTNCAYNAVSALGRAAYGRMGAHAPTRELMRQVVGEAAAVGRAAGARLDDAELLDAVYRLADSMPTATSSTAQDLARGSRTEIEALNGFVVRRAAEAGIATPVNQALYALITLLEQSAGK